MTKQIEALKIEQEVPLTERLKKVPGNARLIVDSADGMSSSVHAVGYLCHKAAEALAEAEKQEPVAWMNDKTPSGIFARHKEGANNFGCDIPLYTHPATWQSLSDDEIVKMANKIAFSWHLNSFDFIEFARAIEQALKEKNP